MEVRIIGEGEQRSLHIGTLGRIRCSGASQPPARQSRRKLSNRRSGIGKEQADPRCIHLPRRLERADGKESAFDWCIAGSIRREVPKRGKGRRVIPLIQ
jgi:hypothetical protein